MFRLKNFSLIQENCGMKITADAVLFGAWILKEVNVNSYTLDIGAGTGILSLMLAHYAQAKVVAVEIDPGACIDLAENIRMSGKTKEVIIENTSIQKYSVQSIDTFDAIVSNPPFYTSGTGYSTAHRQAARHTSSLTHEDLIETAIQKLKPEGDFYCMLPSHISKGFVIKAQAAALYLIKQCEIKCQKEESRLSFLKMSKKSLRLTIEELNPKDSKTLTSDFML